MDSDAMSAAAERGWLATVLAGGTPDAWPDSAVDEEVLFDAAEDEGVVAAVSERLRGAALAGRVSARLSARFAAAARVKAAQSLLREQQCRRILASLHAAGVATLLLKGSALAYWAYREPYLRECSDIDLLFASRAGVDRAVALLDDLGFRPREPVLPGDLVCFEQTCIHDAADALEVDLHWRLSSAPVFAFRLAWDELDAGAITLPGLMPAARGLAPLPAYVHACMHRAQSVALGQGDKLKWLYDLVVLGHGFAAADWATLRDLAVERGVAGVCLDAVQACAVCFGPCAPDAVVAAWRVAARGETLDGRRLHRWSYAQRMNFLAFPTWRQRCRWLRQRLFPNRDYLRWRYGDDRGLSRALFARLHAGVRRWRKSRSKDV